jgi:hypothetical protein
MLEANTPEFAVKVAVLRTPEAFGLKDIDVNPLLNFVLAQAKDDAPKDNLEQVLRNCMFACTKTVNAKVREILFGKAAGDALSNGGDNGKSQDEQRDEKPSGNGGQTSAKPTDSKARSSKDAKDGSSVDGKASVKQIRFIGYLTRQLNREPNYDEIAALTQRQASMRIKDLEKEVASR